MMSAFVESVDQAAKTLRVLFPQTPAQHNIYLSRRTDAHVILKREDLTPVRSYKLRGAFNFMRKRVASGQQDQGFVCASAGNHAQGFAYVCRHFSRKGVVFMPVTTPQQKIQKTQLFGGEWIEIRLIGDYFDDCYAAAVEFSEKSSFEMVSPFDDQDIIEGQATVAYELVAQLGDRLDGSLIVLPVGGGGLAAGVTAYLEGRGIKAEYAFAEPAGAASLSASLIAGKRTKIPHVDNFVDGAAVGEIGQIPFNYLMKYRPEQVNIIPENRICSTMLEMLNVEGVVLEPAGALAIDALKDFSGEALKGRTVVSVVSGGNFDFERLPDVKERSLRFEGLKKYFIFRFPQRPGALRSFLDLLGPEDDITRFEYLKKSARNFGSVLIGIETRDSRNFSALYRRFEAAGWGFQDITDNETIANLII